ncbi:MAG: endolytic transglycosylase MltG [Candidatus Hydrogenedentota bacterium]|nr:MAG: endolytic transglycosylase MltG [Candidatus Hydrogenedentota bacterium]
MKRFSLLFALLLAITGTLVAFLALPPSVGRTSVTIPKDASAATAARILQEAGVVRSAFLFTVLHTFHQRPIKSGTYLFLSGVYPWTASRILADGPPADRPEITVTIPEGFRLEEIAALLEKKGVLVSAGDFLDKVLDPTYAYQITGFRVPSLEGYLFPDTYRFYPGTSADVVIRRMFHRLQRVLRDLPAPRGDTHSLLTLASIVEAESARDEERPRIAAVFRNRLRRGMRLEADPTVRYALNRWDTRPILYKDLDSPSPYNTYRTAGLPPGPICSPGRAPASPLVYFL